MAWLSPPLFDPGSYGLYRLFEGSRLLAVDSPCRVIFNDGCCFASAVSFLKGLFCQAQKNDGHNYYCLLAELKREAAIMDFLPILAARKVKEMLRLKGTSLREAV